MPRPTTLTEAEIKAFTDQTLFAKPKPQNSVPSGISMAIVTGAIIGAALTIVAFMILT